VDAAAGIIYQEAIMTYEINQEKPGRWRGRVVGRSGNMIACTRPCETEQDAAAALQKLIRWLQDDEA
jgi:uncharacterized protein YegP (UPF0339 family)